ncbi:GNAT family N-acetyltransferase [Halobacillus shinanisalinarum]|uniref:GNAT family N-acetyltransferase n=1 Tax=Halobacillus shinanisalinarum TaxID=2932258 RepID=A0ABY4H070_9BACI|nr:GNAT family N-acetyltransferase [Halobacillus shinanisalinarum]UOQ92407.1 GNAT family N-acetyltransferase [Halobacillus shinanisalinarum]
MSNINLNRSEKKIVIRNTTLEDLDEVAALSDNSFGPDIAFKREHFASQSKIFPEGQIIVEFEGKIVGSSSSLIVNFDEYTDKHSYVEISDHGYIRNHNPDGVNLYGVEVCVHPDYRQLKLGRRLYDARKQLCKDLNLKSIIIGGRIPYYHKYADQMSAQEYADQVMKKNIYDPVMTFQMKNGFVLNEMIPGYLPGDDASLEYATSMEWHNEDYNSLG